jgi:alpha-soluble NSF attachment protein
MDSNIAKGTACIAEAEKALSRTVIFGFGQAKKLEDAADAYNRAGNFFKLGNDFKKAAASYKKAVDQWLQTGEDRSEITSAVIEAGNCYKRAGETVKAIDMFERAIEMYNDKGRIGQSARYAKEVAEMVETDGNHDLAIAKYRHAADLFDMDNKKSNSSQCRLKVASLLINIGSADALREAAEVFEAAGRDSLTAKLTSFSAKNHFFAALLVLMAMGDPVQVNNKMSAFKDADFSFNGTRECDFITKLVAAVEAYDIESFETACSDFDRITPLDPWKIKLLLLAKQPVIDANGGVATGADGEVDLS